MFITANNFVYRQIRNLRFAPSLDIVTERLAIDEFECDYIGQAIPVGIMAELQDELSNLWFHGVVVYSEDNHIKVQSTLCYLDRKTMPAKMYEAVPLGDAITECFDGVPTDFKVLYAAVVGKTVSGFAREMTARERLQQLLFVSGTYIQTSFVDRPTVTELWLDISREIPLEQTYYKPKRVYKDYVTDVSVTAFTFTEGTPTQDDEYVTDGTKKWIVSRLVFTQHNPNLPPNPAPNTVTVDDVMLVTNDNASVIATLLGSYYFKRMSVECDIINVAEYVCGEQVKVHMDGDDYTNIVNGFIEDCSFTFGTQAKSRLRLGAATELNAENWVTLTVEYICQSDNAMKGAKLGERKYLLSKGSSYTVTNPYIDKSANGYKYVFRPAQPELSGTIGATDQTVQVNCYTALLQNLDNRVLRIISVDSVERTASTVDGKTIYTAEIE